MAVSAGERAQAELAMRAAQDAHRAARVRLREAKRRWNDARRNLRAWYRHARARMRVRARDYRKAELERIRRQIAGWWQELRGVWERRRRRIDELGLRGVERAKAVEAHRRERLREWGTHRARQARVWSEHRRREAQAESDQEVERNLEAHHPELVPIFREMRRTIKATPRMTRTEVMLQWAHDNPGEVMARTAAREEQELARAIREHEQAEREAQKARRRMGTRKAKPVSRRYAEAVPF